MHVLSIYDAVWFVMVDAAVHDFRVHGGKKVVYVYLEF